MPVAFGRFLTSERSPRRWESMGGGYVPATDNRAAIPNCRGRECHPPAATPGSAASIQPTNRPELVSEMGRLRWVTNGRIGPPAETCTRVHPALRLLPGLPYRSLALQS